MFVKLMGKILGWRLKLRPLLLLMLGWSQRPWLTYLCSHSPWSPWAGMTCPSPVAKLCRSGLETRCEEAEVGVLVPTGV